MIFDQNGNPVPMTNTGINKPDGFGNIPPQGETATITCSCGNIIIYATDYPAKETKDRYCPKCGNYLGNW